MKKQKVHSGFGMVEMLIVVAITGIVAVTLSKMFNSSFKASRTLSSQVNESNISGSLISLLNNPMWCDGSFRKMDNTFVSFDPTVARVNIPRINLGANVLYQVGNVVDGGVTIHNMYFENISVPAVVENTETIAGVDYKIYSAKLVYELKRSGAVGNPITTNALNPILAKIKVRDDATQAIEKCDFSSASPVPPMTIVPNVALACSFHPSTPNLWCPLGMAPSQLSSATLGYYWTTKDLSTLVPVNTKVVYLSARSQQGIIMVRPLGEPTKIVELLFSTAPTWSTGMVSLNSSRKIEYQFIINGTATNTAVYLGLQGYY